MFAEAKSEGFAPKYMRAVLKLMEVKPSEREVLSRPEMDPSSEKHEEEFHAHYESSRQGSFGGHGAAGGGCGCG